jgi:lipopolysaccharide biosynthesis protein
MTPQSLAVLYHIFYEDIMDSIIHELSPLSPYQPYYFFNINAETPNAFEIKSFLFLHFPDCVITISSNKGKDIGGKLILLNICLQLGIRPNWFVFLHDKKSLHALNSKTWKSDLLAIISSKNFDKIETFTSQKDCGIIAANNYVHCELMQDGKFVSTNGPILEDLIQLYKLEIKNHQYVAGTMFWARAKPVIDFFTTFNPLQVRVTLEEGNVIDNYKGSHTHSWERLLSWIITSKGWEIKTT